MVRLIGKLPEKSISLSHDTVLKYGTHVAGTGNASADSGTTMEIVTGFDSVIQAWFIYQMKTGPGYNATLGTGPPQLKYSDGPTIGDILVVQYSSVGVGSVTIGWFAIGDL